MNIIKMVLHIYRAYELFHGKPTTPPADILKKIIRSILDVAPETIHLQLKYSEVSERVLDRVVEKNYHEAMKELEDWLCDKIGDCIESELEELNAGLQPFLGYKVDLVGYGLDELLKVRG